MRVAIIHPWFPQYRKEFFQHLRTRAAARGIEVDIYHGAAPPELRARNDTADSQMAMELPTRYFRIGSRSFGLKSLKPLRRAAKYDLVILEQAVRNLETYTFLLRSIASHVAFWGHGRTYTKEVGRIQEHLKMWLTFRGEWFFAYTRGGAEHVVAAGYPEESVTIVNNSIDTAGLRDMVTSLDDDDVVAFRNRFQLTEPVGLFIGGLDFSKRLDFLVEACQEVWSSVPEFHLLVVGDGPDAQFMREITAAEPRVRHVGSLFGREKAIAMKASQLLVMPGRVGLVAVDSFAAGLPIVTTDWPWHAPEFEYLEDGVNARITENSVTAYASTVTDLLLDGTARTELVQGCRSSSAKYTTELMAARFVEGLISFRATVGD
ncbi:glycosyltransferase family 4 protein [Kocuria arenosa]|uniref:glycosyltransferase family 4 protein n=1 Tax=Kocuria arenosa TaxID=3071446 RepID=UPI0034D56857